MVGVLLDPTRLQRFKEKRYRHVPFGIPEGATEWILIEKLKTEQFCCNISYHKLIISPKFGLSYILNSYNMHSIVVSELVSEIGGSGSFFLDPPILSSNKINLKWV